MLVTSQNEVKKGDYYCIITRNCREFPIAFVALQRLGFNTVIASELLDLEETLDKITLCGLVIFASDLKKFDYSKLSNIKNIFIVKDKELETRLIKYLDGQTILFYQGLIKDSLDKPKFLRVQNDDNLIIVVTKIKRLSLLS